VNGPSDLAFHFYYQNKDKIMGNASFYKNKYYLNEKKIIKISLQIPFVGLIGF